MALTVGAFLGLAGCGGGDVPADRGAGVEGVEGSITVSAATSLTDAFTEIADDFTAANPGAEVTFTFDSSSILATQIIEGAPADVFASADETNMTKLTDEDLVAGEPEVFAQNELVIVTRPGNPEGITELADLAEVDGVISLCAEDAPCGTYAQEALDNAGVTLDKAAVTRGRNAGATLTAVREGDAVAAIVYVTDAQGAGDAVDTVAIATDVNVRATSPIAVLAGSGDPEVAEAFVAHVMGADGQAVLAEYGFLPAP